MSSAFEGSEEPKDRTKLLWIGIIVIFIVMAAVLWTWSQPPTTISQARARHILIAFKKGDEADRARALDQITQLRQRIANGESFGTLARQYSGDPSSSARDGDLGYVKKGELDTTIEAYVWDAPLHQVSEIIQSAYGFHLVEVMDRKLSAADQHAIDLQKKVEEQIRKESTAPKTPAAP